jgi:hypothetical protein
MSEPCVIRRGIFDRWYIFHPHTDYGAWSGSRWVSCMPGGLPAPPDNTQVCNFESEAEARDYCREHELEPGEK